MDGGLEHRSRDLRRGGAEIITRKGLFIIGAVVFLLLAGGASVYTYRVATGEVTTHEPTGNIVTSNVTESQPAWDEMMPYIIESGEMLWVIGDGDETNIPNQWPNTGEHSEKVAESSPDDETTYVYSNKKKYKTDLYDLSELGLYDIEITSLTVGFRFSGGAGATGYASAAVKTSGGTFAGAEESQFGPVFVTRSYRWDTNPDTGAAWTVDEINELQAGARIKTDDKDAAVRLTQVTATVGYREIIIEGDTPTGSLFTVTPHPDFNNYLQVRVYLANTGDLIKAYDHLNLHLRLEDSVEASEIPGYEILSLENGGVTFNLPGDLDGSKTISVTGGSYRLVSANTTNWEEGWTVTPELYLDLSQR